jgi:hypothetical protein
LTFIRPVLATRSGAAPRIDIYCPVLATRSGAAPRIGIPLPRHWQHARGLHLAFICLGVGNTLGDCASHWYSFAPALATRSGAAPYAVNFSSFLNHRRCSICYDDFGSTYSGSTPMTSCCIDSGPRYSTPVSYMSTTPTSSPTMIKRSGVRQRHCP